MYRIGEFSKIVGLPIRTLRYYDECGILKPSEIDVFTGYRYYNDQNIVECEQIILLKSLEFTLDEILQYKNCIDEEILRKKRLEIKERINLLKNKYDKLLEMQNDLEDSEGTLKLTRKKSNKKVLRRNDKYGNI